MCVSEKFSLNKVKWNQRAFMGHTTSQGELMENEEIFTWMIILYEFIFNESYRMVCHNVLNVYSWQIYWKQIFMEADLV